MPSIKLIALSTATTVVSSPDSATPKRQIPPQLIDRGKTLGDIISLIID